MPGKPAPLPRSTKLDAPAGTRRALATIQEVTAPGVDERRWADEIDCTLPAAQQRKIDGQPFERFT